MEGNIKITEYDSEIKNILNSYFLDALNIAYEKSKKSEVDDLIRKLPFKINIETKHVQDLSFDNYLKLISLMRERLNINDLGLILGDIKSVKNFGIYGYALMSSCTFEQFISVADRIFYVIYESLTINHKIKNNMLEISYISKNKIPNNTHILLMEQVLTCGISLMSQQLPEDTNWSECVINCDYPPPSHFKYYRDFFSGKINFNKEKMQLCVPAEWLQLPLKTGNNYIFSLCENKVDDILSTISNNNILSNKIRHILLTSNFNNFPTSKDISDFLHISERSLRLKLSKEETSYREIVNEIRNEVAFRYLTESSLSIQEIAFSLGYTHTQNFYRAFLKKNKITPEKFRQQHK